VIVRRVSVVAVVVGVGLLASGCGGEPAPAESTPLFASEEEAFAAAEQTYREYVDAGNAIDLADPSSFEPVLALTTGEANSNERKSLTQMAAEGWTVSGDSKLIWFRGRTWDASAQHVAARACIDVTEVEVLDADGASQIRPDRRNRYAVDLGFDAVASAPVGLKIDSSTAVEDEECSATKE
jgi:hypothetical protein